MPSARALAQPATRPPLARPAQSTTTAPAPAPPKISIQVRGPLALVELDRPLRLGQEYGQRTSDEVVLDLALPKGARVAQAELRGPGPGAGLRLRPVAVPAATTAYLTGLQGRSWRRAKVPPQVDEGADVRLAVAASGLGEGTQADGLRVRLRFVAPLVCRAGALVLTFPAALDATPMPARVKVDLDLADAAPDGARVDVAGVRLHGQMDAGAALHTTVSTDKPWDLVLTPARGLDPSSPGPSPARGFLFAAAAPARPGAPDTVIAANLCRGRPAARARVVPPPARVLFLIDRSRSMGPSGVASAGALSRALALALPPGTRFAAVLFDREVETPFSTFREPTLEALSALESAAAAGSLRNGTRLLPALRRAEQLLETTDEPAGRGAGGPPSRLLVVITDGALPEDHGRAVVAPLAGSALGQSRAAIVVLRGPHEEPPAPFAVKALGALAGRKGGLVRQLDPVGAAALAPELVAALAAGGDVVDLETGSGIKNGAFDRAAVPPEAGALLLGRGTRGAASVSVRGSLAGRVVRFSTAAVPIDASWAPAIAALGSAAAGLPALSAATTPDAPGGAGERLALLTPLVEEQGQAGQRGQLDRDVVHQALVYAYLPRARACYLTRGIKSAADFQLRGRLRLELHLERGEMMDAVIARSSLGRPDIETCLREAAYLVDVPRPLLADAPAIAALNLVFRPRTDPTAKDPVVPGATSDQIDRLLGPRGQASDPMELLIEDDAPPPEGASVPPGAGGAARSRGPNRSRRP